MSKKIKYLPKLFTKEYISFIRGNDINNNSDAIDDNKKTINMRGGNDVDIRDAYYRTIVTDFNKDLVRHLYDDGDVKVQVVGPYMDVRAVIQVLTKYKPIKQTYPPIIGDNDTYRMIDDSKKIKYISLDDKSMLVKIGDKTYSGSGILIIIKNKTGTDNFIILFKSRFTNKYDDLGGKLHKKYANDEEALFKNAAEEAKTQSGNTFEIKTKSNVVIDIKNNIDGTYYRAYVYTLITDEKDIILRNYITNITSTTVIHHHKTTDVTLFNLKDFKTRLDTIYVEGISQGTYITYDKKEYVRVNGRCMKVIYELYNSGKIGSVPETEPKVTISDIINM